MANPFTMKPASTQFMPGEWEAQQQDIQDQRRYADLLRQQSMEAAPQGNMVSGIYVAPSWTQSLSHALKGWQARQANDQATEQEKRLGLQMQQDLNSWIASKPTDKPAMMTQADTDESGAPIAPRQIPAVPATDQERMAWALRGLSNPLSAGIAAQEYQRMANMAQLRDIVGGGASGQGGAGSTGGIPGVNPTAGALYMSGIPGADKLADAIREGTKPVPLREGDLVDPVTRQPIYTQPKLEAGMRPVRNSQGQVIGAEPIPGYASGAASIKGAEAGAAEGAKSAYDMVTINTPNGPMMVTRAQAAQMAGGGMPSSDVEAIRAFQNRDKSQPFNMTATANGGVAPAAGIRLQGDAGKKFEEGQGKFFSDTYADLQKGAMDANTKIAKYDRMNQLLDGVNTGKLTPLGTELAAYANSIGINVDTKLGNKQAAMALANEIALQLRNPSGGAGMPGALSDKDREFLMSMTPSLGNTPEGNKLLVEGMRKLARRDQDVAKLARQYVAKNGQLDNGFYQIVQDYADSNPLFGAQKDAAPDDIHAQAQAILRGGK